MEERGGGGGLAWAAQQGHMREGSGTEEKGVAHGLIQGRKKNRPNPR
jgi:hypothetical protein